MKKSYHIRSQEDTKKLAKEFSKTLKRGDIVLLKGDLGTGKTFFIREVMHALGYTGFVSSPSFVLHHVYPLKDNTVVHHLDLYRLSGKEALESIGIDDILTDKNAIVFIEWPKTLPHNNLNTIRIEFKEGKGIEEREILFS